MQWPTMEEAFGCLDCHFLFRQATEHACPLCGSASVMDVARFINKVGFNAIETTAGLTEVTDVRLTDKTLQRAIERHMADCAVCESGEPCERPLEIEAAFDNEVNRRIDEAREK
jgi:hypothetical protein